MHYYSTELISPASSLFLLLASDDDDPRNHRQPEGEGAQHQRRGKADREWDIKHAEHRYRACLEDAEATGNDADRRDCRGHDVGRKDSTGESRLTKCGEHRAECRCIEKEDTELECDCRNE